MRYFHWGEILMLSLSWGNSTVFASRFLHCFHCSLSQPGVWYSNRKGKPTWSPSCFEAFLTSFKPPPVRTATKRPPQSHACLKLHTDRHSCPGKWILHSAWDSPWDRACIQTVLPGPGRMLLGTMRSHCHCRTGQAHRQLKSVINRVTFLFWSHLHCSSPCTPNSKSQTLDWHSELTFFFLEFPASQSFRVCWWMGFDFKDWDKSAD